MKLDKVHDIQKIYRKVLDLMSRPGKIANISDEVKEVQPIVDIFDATFGLMLMLLDMEVSFHIVSANSEKIAQMISQLTYGKQSDIEQADYVFVLKDVAATQLAEVFKQVKVGELFDPQKSATLIVEAMELTNEKELIFRGPGIKDTNLVNIGLGNDWIGARKDVNIEFPLGVDTIFIDGQANVLCLPRTTQILSVDEVS